MTIHLLRNFLIAVGLYSACLLSANAEPRTQNAAPPNDNFLTATVLTNTGQLTLGNIYNGTRELGEVKPFASGLGRTVWYKYTASITGRSIVVLATPSDNVLAPLQLAAYRGSTLRTLVRLSAFQIQGQTKQDKGSFAFDTIAGQTYYFQVDIARQSNSYYGYFLIGIRQFGGSGGLATFTNTPTILREDDYIGRRILVANGYRSTASLLYSIMNLGVSIDATPELTSLGVSQTTWFNLTENNLGSLAAPGAVQGSLLISAQAANGSILGSASEPVVGIRRDYTDRGSLNPSITVRVQYPGQGTRGTNSITSNVVVRNNSSIPVTGCTFHPYDRVYTLRFFERMANGTAANPNAPFTLSPGQVRRFSLTSAAGWTSYDRVYFNCSNDQYSNLGDDYFSELFAYTSDNTYFPKILIDPLTVTDLRTVAIRDFQTQKVVVKLTNAGAFAGYFRISVNDDAYESKAVVESFCVSNAAGTCIGVGSTSSVETDLAVGEIGYLALSVRRGSSPSSGYVRIFVETAPDESPSYAGAGYGGFEVVRAP